MTPTQSPAPTSSISLAGALASRNRMLCCVVLGTRGRPAGPYACANALVLSRPCVEAQRE